MRCKYESETMRALYTGAPSNALIEHQKNCTDCRETVLVAEALRQDASDLASRNTPPSLAVVWAEAERHRQMAALARATRFLNILKIAGVVYGVVFIFWALYSLAAHGLTMPGLDVRSSNAVIEGAGLAMLFIGSGLWYTLRRDERLTN
ncbi:hypothetical protein [Alloacidobacterium sp.]|uniref:hypothetical protein n=1 Tax=Alloacidobacterium sp. TaxID=2951999 RepID=UPI002D593C34|nr:hypothetical protein [Alloacidobacterium sp.]HYK34608.1 hypothetical protein [Alloacidobacterium sp.]